MFSTPATRSRTTTLLRLHPSYASLFDLIDQFQKSLFDCNFQTSSKTHSQHVTGGVYKVKVQIHRDILIHDY
jgi:hypothetical protein